MRDGGADGAWDVAVRLREMDREGIAAEVVLAGHQYATLPFFSVANLPCSADLRMAGAMAYNRRLVDFLFDAGGRLVGDAVPGPCIDMQATWRRCGGSPSEVLRRSLRLSESTTRHCRT